MPNPLQWSVAPASDFARLAAAWDAINRGSANLPILDASFFALLLKHFGVRNGATAAMLHERTRPLCAAILEPGKLGSWQTYQPSQAPLGAFVHTAGFEAAAVLPSLFRAVPGRLSLAVGLSQLDPNLLSRPTGASRIETLDYIETATLHVDGSFEDYWAARGKNLRQNVKKQRNRLEKAGVKTQLILHTAPTAVAAAVDEYGALESRGWKAGEGTALHPDNAQGRFYRELLQERAAVGEALVYQYLYDDQLVASDLCVARDGVLIILKTTYDEAHNSSSPAMSMHYEMLQPIFDERRFRRIEFYGRVMEWHGRLTESKRVLYHLNCYRLPWFRNLVGTRRALTH
jgi:CelD/BcsL family acetyltransferase involved in cellulose biosynthesis